MRSVFSYADGRSSWLVILLAAAVSSTVIMFPVLIWPHYGLFSDAGQIIEFPKQIIAGFPESLRLLGPLPDGRWNPAFHGLSALLYYLQPDTPLIFFVAQWLMLVGTLLCIGALIRALTGNIAGALIGMLVLVVCSSLFENFYTLDKVEPRITLFSALAILAFQRALKKSTGANSSGYFTESSNS
jgi:putative effector of murein hydrolase LrgA (UPF0299 family)